MLLFAHFGAKAADLADCSKVYHEVMSLSRTKVGGHYFKERTGTEQFRHIILRNGTGSNAHTTAKYTCVELL